ncbi:putative late blight resistance protein R1B-16 [Salvia divinorum]|uniref:Late blight resistance protein R1B-16 n=1 Tax=Salvia divinorum TaxID=28513 RepID=A0ABD1G5A9_SALDI
MRYELENEMRIVCHLICTTLSQNVFPALLSSLSPKLNIILSLSTPFPSEPAWPRHSRWWSRRNCAAVIGHLRQISTRRVDMAYAALLSALQALKKATQQDFISNLLSIKNQITILDEKFRFLQDFLENDPPPASRDVIHILEGRIREAAYRAEDIIDFHFQDKIVTVPLTVTLPVPVPVTMKTSYWRTLSAVWRFFSLSNKQGRIKDVRADSRLKLYQYFQEVVNEVDSILQEVVLIKESREFESLHMNDHHPPGDADDVGSSKITPTAMEWPELARRL